MGQANQAETGGLTMPHDPTSAPPSDEELACRAQQGCAAAFEQLARRFQVPLLHFLGRRTATAADAEDLAQDTFVRAYQRLGQYRAPLRFSTWLFTIAHRLSINRRRQRQPAANPEALESAAAAVPQPGQEMAEQESRRRLWDAAQAVLTEDQVTALWLYYVEEMSVQQIAQVLDRTRIGVKAMMFRARRRLSASLPNPELEAPAKGCVQPNPKNSCQNSMRASHV